MNTQFNGIIVEENGIRSISGGGTNASTATGALANLGGYPASNPSGYLTGIDTSNFYTNDNPSGYITGIENLVYITGDQSISGIKTFSNGISSDSITSIQSGYSIGLNENSDGLLGIQYSGYFDSDPTWFSTASVKPIVNQIILSGSSESEFNDTFTRVGIVENQGQYYFTGLNGGTIYYYQTYPNLIESYWYLDSPSTSKFKSHDLETWEQNPEGPYGSVPPTATITQTQNSENSTNFGINRPLSNGTSWEWNGFFRPQNTSNHDFNMYADEDAYFWIGDKALNGYTTGNADMYSSAYAQSTIVDLALTSGVSYPVRLQWGHPENPTTLGLSLSYNDGVNSSNNFSGLFFHGLSKVGFNIDGVSGNAYFAGNLQSNSATFNRLDGATGVFDNIEASNLVYTTGDQTISGIKTFAQGFEVGSGFVGTSTLYVSSSGTVGINNEDPQASLDVSGSVLFSQRPTVNGTGVMVSGDINTADFYLNNNPSGYITGIQNLVYTTGDQAISGIKTFANNVTILGDFAVSGTTFVNEVIDVTTTGTISGVTGVFQHLQADNIVYSQTNSYIVAQAGDDLIVKYAEAAALTPNGSAKSATNRASLIIMPGNYSLSAELVINVEFVDIVGLGAQTQKPAVLVSNNTLNVSTDDVRVSGISVDSQRFKIAGNKPLQIFENCIGGNYSFNVGNEEQLSGTFINCIAGNDSFDAGVYGNVNGKFTNCVAGNYSFGGASYGLAGGTFTNCTGGNRSFGGTYATGTFTSCTAGNNSFGSQGDYAVVSGIFTNCKAGNNSFAGEYGGGATGTFIGCTGGAGSFAGYFGGASGIFTNCTAGGGSFGGLYSSAGGTFTNCTAAESSFGSDNILARGVFIGCRITAGEFSALIAPSVGKAIMINCIDANGNIIEGEASA